MQKTPPTDRPILEFNEKDIFINLMFDTTLIYPNISNELLKTYDSYENTSETPEGRHIRNAIFVKLIQTYYMFVEQSFGWIHSLRIWKNNCNANLLQLMEAVQTMSLNKIQETINEFTNENTKTLFLSDFITSESNTRNQLSDYFNKLFSIIDFDEDTTTGNAISKIYNKTKHGGLILAHPEFKTFLVPEKVDAKSKERSLVSPVFIPNTKRTFLYIKLSMEIAAIQFIKIIEIIYTQKYGELSSELKSNMGVLLSKEVEIEKEYHQVLKDMKN